MNAARLVPVHVTFGTMHAWAARVAPRAVRAASRTARAPFHAGAAALLPRSRGVDARPQARSSESVVPVEEHMVDEAPPPEASSGPSLPWFMQEEVVNEPETEEVTGAPIAWLPPYTPATADVPDALATLFDMLVSGTLSTLVARPKEPASEQWGDVVR